MDARTLQYATKTLPILVIPLTLSYRLTSKRLMTLHFRGSVSTGFRAPTIGQSNVVNVTTAFGANGLEDQATIPPTNPIAVQLGAVPR